MQITVKSTKVGSTGTNNAGPWELIIVTSDDGTDYTTFHTGCKKLTPGSVIEFEPKISKGKCSFKEYKVISEGQVPATPDNGKPGMTPEAWAEKDRLERFSRECNTCFMGIPELLKAKPPADGKAKDVYEVALDWALDHLQATKLTQQPTTKPAPAATTSKSTPTTTPTGTFANVGKFFTACLKEGVSRKAVLEKLGVKDSAVSSINTEDAWQVISEDIIKPSHDIEK